MRGLAAHTARNLTPILEVLQHEFRNRQDILEIGSGSGQHATGVCASLGHLKWQTSDRKGNLQAINTWLDAAGVASVKPPLALDILEDPSPDDQYDAVFSANTAHIMSVAAVEKMFEVVSGVLRGAGIFCLYGPFRLEGRFNSESNADFHRSLRAKDRAMGIRHLESLDEFGQANGMRRDDLYAMPSNNMLVVWRSTKGG